MGRVSTARMAPNATTRVIELGLSKFPALPAALVDPDTKAASDTLSVDVKNLFHHYYLAKYGDDGLDDGVYEYERKLTSDPDWRFRGTGIGTDTESRRNVSNELGKAFARWFLYSHFEITYFCPFQDVLERKNPDGSMWKRRVAGDLPDYVCGKDQDGVNLLEAKGRYSSITFDTKEFEAFRTQLARAQLLDAQGRAIQVKGYIAATRWATQKSLKVKSKLLVEDPTTEGDPPSQDGYPGDTGLSMVAGHYVPALERLQLPAVADAIRDLHPLPQRSGPSRGLWECVSGPLSGRRFVGGVIPDRRGIGWAAWWPFLGLEEDELRHIWKRLRPPSPFVLVRPLVFFGLEESVFNKVVEVARRGLPAAGELERVNVPERTGSLSLLRDGSVLGPADYFEPVGVKQV